MAGARTPEERGRKLKGSKVRDINGVLFGVIEDILIDERYQQPRWAVVRFPISVTQGYQPRKTVVPLDMIDDRKGGPFLPFKSQILAQGPVYRGDVSRLPFFEEYWEAASKAYGPANATYKRFRTPLVGTIPEYEPGVPATEPPTASAP